MAFGKRQQEIIDAMRAGAVLQVEGKPHEGGMWYLESGGKRRAVLHTSCERLIRRGVIMGIGEVEKHPLYWGGQRETYTLSPTVDTAAPPP